MSQEYEICARRTFRGRCAVPLLGRGKCVRAKRRRRQQSGAPEDQRQVGEVRDAGATAGGRGKYGNQVQGPAKVRLQGCVKQRRPGSGIMPRKN